MFGGRKILGGKKMWQADKFSQLSGLEPEKLNKKFKKCVYCL